MASIPELLETNYDNLPINDLIVTINHLAEKAESHVAFQGELPEYVTRPAQLRQLAETLGKARDAAAGGDRDRSAEKKALIESCKMALSMNALHIVMLSLHRNDPTIRLNAGYEEKHKSTGKAKVNLLEQSPDVLVKHGSVSGHINLLIKRARQNASIEVQTTDGDPNDEGAWKRYGEGVHNKSRIELKGQEPAKKIYFRARYHEDGGTGPWSAPVGIIVL